MRDEGLLIDAFMIWVMCQTFLSFFVQLVNVNQG